MKGIIFIILAVGFMFLFGGVFAQSPTPTVTPGLKSGVSPSATPSFALSSDQFIFPNQPIESTGNSYVDARGIPIESGVFIVKLKESPLITGVYTNIESINILNLKYRVYSIERKFKGFDSTNKKIEEKKKEFPVRAKRAPKNAIIPKLENIYEFRVLKEENIFEIVREYLKDPSVEYAEPVFKEIRDVDVNDPHFIRDNPRKLWNIFKIQADLAWDYFDINKNGKIDGNEKKPGEGVIVAIVDYEFDVSHEDLKDNLWKSDIKVTSGLHGTHMGGTVAATGDNGIGVVGVAWGAKLMPTDGAGPEKIIEATDFGADVLADSSPSLDFSKVTIDAIDYATAQGAVVVASAGNRNVDTYGQAPSQAESAISVASSDYFDHKASSSNWGSKIDVIAPGDYILSTIPGNRYTWESGTSFSAPHVAGVAALLLSKNLALTVEQIRQILRTSADDLVDPLNDGKDYSGWDIYSGYGRLNANKALQSNLLCEANIKFPTVNYIENKYLWDNPVDPKRSFYDARVLVEDRFDVKGIADSPSFSYYLLELGEGENPKEWELLKKGDEIVSNDLLSQVNLAGKSNQKKTIRLSVFTKDGKSCEDRVIIQPSFAIITSPVEGNLYFPRWTDVLNFVPFKIEGEEEMVILHPGIRGFVNHPDLVEWSLWYQIPGSEEKLIERSNLKFALDGSFDLRLRDNVLLEKWNPEIPDGNMKIILKVKTKDGIEYRDEVSVNYDGTHFPYQKGWPQKIKEWGYATVSPVIYDVDGKGGKEIITGTSYGLYLYNNDGTFYNEKWPLVCDLTKGVYFCNQNIDSSPTVGDLDSDGLVEIGIKSKDYNNKEYIHLFNLQGEELEGWPKEYSFTGRVGFMEAIARSTIVFSDINNDGVLDIIYGILGQDDIEMDRIYVYDGKGGLLWSQKTDDRIVKNLAVGDLDGDGSKEIVAMSEKSVYVFSSRGEKLYQWSFSNGDSFINPVLADVDGNGEVEIIAGDQRGEQAGTIYIWNEDGSIFSKTSITNTGKLTDLFFRDMYQPMVWDLDGDGKLEIFVAASFYEIIDTGKGYANTPTYTVLFAFENDGRLIDGWPKKYDIYEIGDTYFPGILADVDGDNLANLIIGSWFSLGKAINVFDTKGDLIKDPRFPLRVNHIYYSSPAVGDLDGDGDIEVVFMENAVNHIYVWDLPFSVSNMEWPMFQHDAQHTGLYGYVQPEINKRFIRGDSNEDGEIDLSDAIFILRYLFQGGTMPNCLDSSDANDDGKIDLSDAVYLLNYLFQGSNLPPPPPFNDPGKDPTQDGLDCACYGEGCAG